MKAIVQERYGPLDEVLQLQEVASPSAGTRKVLVRTLAASVHIGDCHMIRGVPKLFRPLVYGARRPRNPIPGTDIAGIVESIGPGVTGFAPGDEVLGWCSGAFATEVVAGEGSLARKPDALNFEEASALGVSAMTALQALRDHGKLQAGQHVLIVGASGGVGTFAVQIAKAMGAEVTGVCSTRNVELVRSIGADHVIDYTNEDFTTVGPRYDLIFDNVGKQSLAATRRPLKAGGTLLSNGAPVGGWVGGLGHMLRAALASIVVRQQARPFISMPSSDDLADLLEMVEAGQLRPVIDHAVPLAETAAAIAHVASGHNRGTTVITMPDAAPAVENAAVTALLVLAAAAIVVVTFLAVAFVLGMRRRSPLVHGPIFWISRRWLNPKQMRTAGQPGAYAGIIRHVGRRTGRAHETPVGVMATEDGLLIALPYGRRPSWLQNVVVAGSATVVHEGVTHEVSDPRIVPMAQVLERFGASDRLSMRILRTDECLRLSSR